MWVGTESNKFERNGAIKRAAQYIDAISDGRDKSKVQMVEIAPCKEPSLFKVQFPNWDDAYA